MASLADASPPIALGALDGRYRSAVAPLLDPLSEAALNRERVRVEVEWLIHLTTNAVVPGVRALTADEQTRLRAVVEDFGPRDVAELAEIERETVHDVKAVEYYLKRRLPTLTAEDGAGLTAASDLTAIAELVHFGCTSEDINNLSYALMVKGAVEQVWLPRATALVDAVAAMARELRDVPLLAHTHGQPATPTTLGKEMANFAARLARAIHAFERVPLKGKMNGAVGNYNAHVAAYPDVDWEKLAARVVTSLGLEFNPYTTQIEPHDAMAEYFDAVARIGTILIDVDRDLWGYVSLGYFRQKLNEGEVGSSTMPHKVNPIDFENSEGNLGLANALLRHLSAKLPISRWQRDLTDSTVLRNLGVALGHALLGWTSLRQGLAKLEVDATCIAEDLDANWEVLAEAIQTVMRRYGVPQPYERLKALTRGRRGITQQTLREFIAGLALPDDVKASLADLTPSGYVGLAAKLARRV